MQIVSICMKCQSLFSGKGEKNINLSTAESTQTVVKVNVYFQGNEITLNIGTLYLLTIPPKI